MSVILLTHLLTLALVMGLLLSAALGDIKTYRIPNAVSLSLLALYPVFALTAPYSVDVPGSLAVMAVVLAAGLAIYATRSMGGGDVKLLSVVALYAGPSLVLELLIITALSGGVVAILMLNQGVRLSLAFALDRFRSHTLRDMILTEAIPYGVAIAAGGTFMTLRLVGLAADAVP